MNQYWYTFIINFIGQRKIMKNIEIYETLRMLMAQTGGKLDYFEALVISHIAYNKGILNSQKILIYMRKKNYDSEILSTFGSSLELVKIWKITLDNLTKESGPFKRNEQPKDLYFESTNDNKKRFEYARFIEKQNKNSNSLIREEWNSYCFFYYNIHGNIGQFQNEYYNIYYAPKRFSRLFDTYGHDIHECYYSLKMQQNINLLFYKNNKKEDIILLSPNIVNKLIILPFNQMLYFDTHKTDFIFPNTPRCLTLCDSPNSFTSINDLKFDLFGNSIKNKRYLEGGHLNYYYGQKPGDKIIQGNTILNNSNIIYSMIFPVIECGKWKTNRLYKEKFNLYDDYIGKFNLYTKTIDGTFISYDENGEIFDSLFIKIDYQQFLYSIIGFTDELFALKNVLPCSCPYMLIERKSFYETKNQ